MENTEKRLSRRRMLAGTGAVAVAGTVAACSQGAPGPGGEAGEGNWDHECDVLCIGSGAAASTAAVFAANAGAKAMVLEKMPIAGGTTAKSGGVCWVFNHFLLKEQGIDDNKADALKYAARFGFARHYNPASPNLGIGDVRYKVLEAFYDKGAEAIDALRELDVMQFKQFRLFQIDRPAPDYADHLPENKVPTGRCLEPAVGSGSSEGGGSMAAQLHKHLKASNVPIMLDTKVTKIVRNADGRVIGVEADQAGKPIRVKANKGVVFGTGGYSHSAELCDLHQPFVYGTCALTGSTGDFIPLAQGVGAMMGSLGTAWRSQVVMGEALQNRGVGWGAFVLPGDSMILVNKHGKRVVNEKRDYNDRAQAHFPYDAAHEEYPNHLMFMLFDARSRDAFGGAFPFPAPNGSNPHMLEGSSWEDLAGKIAAQLKGWEGRIGGVALAPGFAANVRETVARFNDYARAGNDPEFDRGKFLYDREWHLLFSARRTGTEYPENPYPNNVMHPFTDSGPYYAIVLGPGTLDTSGGPQVNENAQVLAANGEPIPGLYGAGNCIAAPTGQAYLGAGGTIGPAVTFGYIAGKHAANS